MANANVVNQYFIQSVANRQRITLGGEPGLMMSPQSPQNNVNGVWQLVHTSRKNVYKIMNTNTLNYMQFLGGGVVAMVADADAKHTNLQLTNGIGSNTGITEELCSCHTTVCLTFDGNDVINVQGNGDQPQQRWTMVQAD